MSSYSNPMFFIDGYKLDHRRQYPAGITRVYSNFTPRHSRVPGVDKIVFFGLQRFLTALSSSFDDFFARPGGEVADEYADLLDRYLGPNSVGTDHIRDLHRLGYLPLRICALPEGSAVAPRIPVLTIENTHPDFFWLVNYLETIISAELWLPCTSATTARRLRQILDTGALLTGGDPNFVQWQGHDFSFRGMGGLGAAGISGLAHLLFFTGTDTIPALFEADEYYGPLPPNYLLGGSVAATEHSVMSAGGEVTEFDTYSRLLDLYPTGILSVVSDTWDLWNVIEKILPALKDKIMARDGKLVIRPDSGDPVKIICGDRAADQGPGAPEGSPQWAGVVQLLWDLFGGTLNEKGYKVLNPKIGVIYGDGINDERMRWILYRLERIGFASTNIVFGVGSYTYQMVTRDTYGWAMKATWAEINGEGVDLYKDPITDDGVKRSARGRLAVLPKYVQGQRIEGEVMLIEMASPEQEAQSLLTPVWSNGSWLRRETFDVIRERALSTL